MNAINEEKSRPLASLMNELSRGIGFINKLDDISYRRGAGTSVGAQFRHNLDFVLCLLKGIGTGRIDYNDRKRDTQVESDRDYACQRFECLIDQLSHLEERFLGRSVIVRSEIDNAVWLPSSIAREVEFVHSHTVHHHALIAEKLARCGIKITRDFGVAPSTLEHWARKAA